MTSIFRRVILKVSAPRATEVRAENSKKIIRNISKKLEFSKPGHGIAFTVPLESIAGVVAARFSKKNLTVAITVMSA